jgi:CcmD family protein
MTSNKSFIIAAYAVAWIMIIGYTFRLFAKGARAEAEFARHARDAERGA